jgi:hypothetical protein
MAARIACPCGRYFCEKGDDGKPHWYRTVGKKKKKEGEGGTPPAPVKKKGFFDE